MMMDFTRPQSGIGRTLSDDELQEFNQITYDKIRAMKSLPKLMRLEQYMREEGFPQTAELARKMVVELGGKDSCPNESEPQFADVDAEFDAFLKNFDSWQATVKGADHKLRDLGLSKETDGQAFETAQCTSALHSKVNGTFTGQKTKKDIRSGRAYYEQWDKYAVQSEKELAEEEKEASQPKQESNGDKKGHINAPRKENRQQRLLSLTKSKSMTEREWFAEREREKGNDLFKAKEYSASLDAYTLAIDLFAGSALAFGNRAAANIKLKRWDEAHKDCCTALELDPNYVKALMRRGLASLEMDKPEDAMQDLQAAVKLDPGNQEVISLIRLAEKALQKLKQKQADEVSKSVADESPCNTTDSTWSITGAKRLRIEEVEEIVEVEETGSSPVGAAKSGRQVYALNGNEMMNGHTAGEVDPGHSGIIDAANQEGAKRTYTWPSNQSRVQSDLASSLPSQPDIKVMKKVGNMCHDHHIHGQPVCSQNPAYGAKSQSIQTTLESNVDRLGSLEAGSYKDGEVNKAVATSVLSGTTTEVEPDVAGSRSHGRMIEEVEQTVEGKDSKSTISEKAVDSTPDQGTVGSSVGACNDVSKGQIKYKESREIFSGTESLVPSSIDRNGCEAEGNQGADSGRETQVGVSKSYSGKIGTGKEASVAAGKIEGRHACDRTPMNGNAKLRDSSQNQNVLAEEWRLTGNSFFAKGETERAEQSYTTSLKYMAENPATLSNRAMCRLKLKKYKDAEEDASKAISIDRGFHKAYFRRGLARRALGRLEGARADFKLVLAASPGDRHVLAELESIEAEIEETRYLPMRVGPMIFEEVEDVDSLPTAPVPREDKKVSVERCHNEQPVGTATLKANIVGQNCERPHTESKGELAPQHPDVSRESDSDLKHTSVTRKDSQLLPTSELETRMRTSKAPGEECEGIADAASNSLPEEEIRGSATGDLPSTEHTGGSQSSVSECMSNVHDVSPEERNEIEQQAEEEKRKGNTCFRKGQYTLAVDCYSRSLALHPTGAAVLANRALCYIQLREFQKAVEDSSLAIRMAPGYTKAYHRRGTALYSLGDLRGALHDYQIVAVFEPSDKKLQKDIEELEKAIAQESLKPKANADNSNMQPILIAEPAPDGAFMKPVKTTIYRTQETSAVNECDTAADPNANLKPVEQPKDAATRVTSNGSPAYGGKNRTIKNSKGLPRTPTTALEFERVCLYLREQPEVLRECVKSIEVDKYPALFKESLSPGIVRSFVDVLRKGFMPNDAVGALGVLEGLAKVKRFALTLMLLSHSEKQGFETIFYWLEWSSDVPSERVMELKSRYQLS